MIGLYSTTTSSSTSGIFSFTDLPQKVRIDLKTFKAMFEAINLFGIDWVEQLCHEILDGRLNSKDITNIANQDFPDHSLDIKWLVEFNPDYIQKLENIILALKEERENILRAFLPGRQRNEVVVVLPDYMDGFYGFQIMARAGCVYVIDSENHNKAIVLMTVANFLNNCHYEFAGLDLSNLDLRGVDLRGRDLHDANLSGANLEGENLSQVNLQGVNLYAANLGGAILSGANLINANFEGANLTGADLRKSDLSNANLKDATLEFADLSEADLSGANLSRATLDQANLTRANLCEANLSYTKLQTVKLVGAKFDHATVFHGTVITLDLPQKWDPDALTKQLTHSPKTNAGNLLTAICSIECMNADVIRLRLIHQLIDSLGDVDVSSVKPALRKALISNPYFTKDIKVHSFIMKNDLATI